MRPRWRRLAAAVMVAAMPLLLAAGASGNPQPPIDLRVWGGEDAWRPNRTFNLSWENPPSVAAVHYRVRDPLGGMAIEEQRIDWATRDIDGLQVPALPGAYTAEVWLEDRLGTQGAAASAKLRFDDTRPGPSQPLPGSAWIGRNGFPLTVRLRHPAGPAPLSGIRGYAFAVGADPGAEPCAAENRCTDAETDLHGGAGNDSFSIVDLPEGTSYVRAVAVSGAGMRSAGVSGATLRVDKTDPLTRLSAVPSGWANEPVTLTATAVDAGSGMEPAGDGSVPFTAIRVDGGTPAAAAGARVSITVVGEGVHAVAAYARDLAGNVDDGGDSNGLPNRQPSIVVVRIDRSPPDVAFADAQGPHDPELIRARVADRASGPTAARGWIGVRRAGSGDPFAPLPTERSREGELSAHWDSDACPAGRYEFQATGYDAAGNVTIARHRGNGAAMVLDNPLKERTSLLAGFPGRRPAERTAHHGRGALLRGRLTGAAGQPLPGRPVRIAERFAPGAGEAARESTVWTDTGGRFSIRLSPGPSREVTTAFDGSPTLSRSASRSLRLAVRSGVRLRASSAVAEIGGRPLVFRGRVEAEPGTIPPSGRSVQLQFRLPSLPWSEFRTIQTDRRGRFRYAYRFSDDDSRGARFQFRAYVPAQDGWPYEPAGSRPIAVSGR